MIEGNIEIRGGCKRLKVDVTLDCSEDVKIFVENLIEELELNIEDFDLDGLKKNNDLDDVKNECGDELTLSELDRKLKNRFKK